MLCIPSAFPRCTPATGTQPCCFGVCCSHCTSEEDLPPSFTKSLLEQKGGRRGQKIFTPCFGQVGPRAGGSGSCPGAVSCSLALQELQGEGLNSKGASTQWAGTRLEGGLDWRNRRSCTRFWAEQQDCSTRTAQGHSSWHIV